MPGGGDYRQRMEDMWEGVLPIVATEQWVATWESSPWRSRPAPDPQAYADARLP